MEPPHNSDETLLVAKNTLTERSQRTPLSVISAIQYTDIVSAKQAEIVIVRQKVRDLAQSDDPEQNGVFEEFVDALILYDKDIPKDPMSGLLAIAGIGKRVREVRKKRTLYRKIIVSILEQMFDPGLDFKMTKKNILDIFEANDIDRDNVAPQQISQIYSKVLYNLRTGQIRDYTLNEGLQDYVRLKLEHISESRQKWETDR